jgi:predicted TIM-barrel fold metal-dependent hydrolase
MRLRLLTPLVSLATVAQLSAAQGPPVVDHHQHLFSPAVAPLIKLPEISAADLIARLDSAGIQRAVVLSMAYQYGSPSRTVEDEYAKVRAENDWTAAQVGSHPDRLVGFCGLNPLKPYAVEEVERCAKNPYLRTGLKLHFGNSDVQLDVPEQVAQLKREFAVANAHHMAIVVHMRANSGHTRPYGAKEARVFLEQVVPSAPDVMVQVAHLAGSGGGEDPAADSALAFLAHAMHEHAPGTRNLWFDVTAVANDPGSPAHARALVGWMREIGMDRLLFGSDATAGGNLSPKEAWAAFCRLPLTKRELALVAENVAPYLR